MNRVRRHVHLLHLLSSASPQQRKAILRTANKEQIKSICEICQNLLSGNIPVSIKKLRTHRKIIRQLADKKIPFSKKRKLFLNQTGGFLPFVIPAVLSLLSGIAGKAIGNRI